ncbi:MAG TPA: hypothetical protein P5077_01060 [bacterium]|nr:hypothetical protein [bacterium]
MFRVCLVLAIVGVLAAGVAACASQKTGFSSGQKDIVVETRDPNWDFSTLRKVYLYTETVNSSEERDAIAEMVKLLTPRGIECIVDTGESMTYDNPSIQIRAHRKLMSLLTSIYLLKPGIKGNEEIIAVISSDNPLKAAAEAIKYIEGARPAGGE